MVPQMDRQQDRRLQHWPIRRQVTENPHCVGFRQVFWLLHIDDFICGNLQEHFLILVLCFTAQLRSCGQLCVNLIFRPFALVVWAVKVTGSFTNSSRLANIFTTRQCVSVVLPKEKLVVAFGEKLQNWELVSSNPARPKSHRPRAPLKADSKAAF